MMRAKQMGCAHLWRIEINQQQDAQSQSSSVARIEAMGARIMRFCQQSAAKPTIR